MTRGQERRRTLFISVPWSSPFADFDGAHPRAVDWQLTGARRVLHHLREAWRVHRAADDVLLVTGAMEVYFLCAFSLLRAHRRLMVFDFLRPRARWGLLMGRLLLWRVDRWLVVRTSDIRMLHRRFGIDSSRCAFAPFPGRPSPVPPQLGEYVYAAGIAHRDWSTLLQAAEQVDVPFIVSCDPRLVDVPPNVDARGLVTPDEGRALSARARLVVVPLLDSELPSGPLVVVDAQANGKGVIATDVGGTRDYVIDGQTGWLVAPGDADGLAERIADVYPDTDLIAEVGSRARLVARNVDACWALLLQLAQEPRP